MFTQDRSQLRSVYLEAWRKAREGLPLAPIEQQVVDVARRHPEYHALLEAGEAGLQRDYLPEQGETNPFLHLALHIAILEQLSTDRPAGMRKLYQQLVLSNAGDTHEAEHTIMECLAEAIWRLQRDDKPFDEKAYVKCIRKRGGGRRPRG